MPFSYADAAGLGMLVGLVAIIGWVMVTVIKARHGYAIDDSVPLGSARKIELLETENSQLRGTVDRLEERLAVLERIATDPANRLGHEIEALRR